jgi:hypothetical protein
MFFYAESIGMRCFAAVVCAWADFRRPVSFQEQITALQDLFYRDHRASHTTAVLAHHTTTPATNPLHSPVVLLWLTQTLLDASGIVSPNSPPSTLRTASSVPSTTSCSSCPCKVATARRLGESSAGARPDSVTRPGPL